jgi:L-fuconolactonase
MAVLAGFPQVFCKFSGLVTEAAPGAGMDAIAPYAEALLELFGPQRLIFGSDWPVVTTHQPYDIWWNWAHRLTASLSAGDRAAIFGGTARAFYGLPASGILVKS